MSTLELPIFPLSIVLFPGTPQLLHIFEPRYRQMLADCLEGDTAFGLSYVPDPTKPDSLPSPGDLGCCALIKDTRLLPDGRSNILALGGERYTILDYVQSDLPYLVARVELFDDEETEEPEIETLARRVRSVFLELVEGMNILNDRTATAPDLSRDPKELSFQVAAGLDLEAPIKLELLAMRSAMQRLDRLDHILHPLNAEVRQRAAVHARGRGNGKGGGRSDIVNYE
jgi:Lon protease-like protein